MVVLRLGLLCFFYGGLTAEIAEGICCDYLLSFTEGGDEGFESSIKPLNTNWP